MSAGVLDPILERKRLDLAARTAALPLSRFIDGLLLSERDFRAALEGPGLSLIAEIKQRSPSKGLLRANFDPATIARRYQRSASAISVLTDGPFFGGALEHLAEVRAAASLPVLAKDFVIDLYQLYEARHRGADAVLLIARVLSDLELERCLSIARRLHMAALVEIHSAAELSRVLAVRGVEIIGVNSRDIDTLAIDPELVFRLGPQVRAAGKLLVAESGLETPDGVARLCGFADAVLIGSALMAAPDLDDELARLGFPPREDR